MLRPLGIGKCYAINGAHVTFRPCCSTVSYIRQQTLTNAREMIQIEQPTSWHPFTQLTSARLEPRLAAAVVRTRGEAVNRAPGQIHEPINCYVC